MKTLDIIRIVVTIVILIFMWLGDKWALYMAVTLMTVSFEMLAMVVHALIKK